jgi:hypothetical protein
MTGTAAGGSDRGDAWPACAGGPAPSSGQRFPDGGAFRVEIPSVEGPRALEAVLGAADELGVPVHRVSQGSGVSMLSDAEIASMVATCATHDVELCLFLGPRGTWDVGGGVHSAGGSTGPRVRGGDQLRYSLDDAVRAADLGVRCLLVADEGVLWAVHLLRDDGVLPADLTLKLSALAGPANPAAFQVVQRLGADSVNVPGDLSVHQLAELRAAGPAAIDLYVESPDGVGGFVRHHELPEFVRVAAPVYLKFGLRNAPDIYPVGEHLVELACSTGRERVRRASLGLALLERHRLLDRMSPVGARRTNPVERFPGSRRPDPTTPDREGKVP